MSRWLQAGIRWGAAAALSMSILAHASGYDEFNGRVLVVWFGLTAGFALLIGKLWPRIAATGPAPGGTMLVALAAVLSIALHYVLPMPASAFLHSGELVLTGSSERDPRSRGSEVWATVRQQDGGRVLPAASIGEGWKQQDNKGVMLASGQPTTVRWKVRYDAGWELQLLRHPGSGIVDIDWLGERRRVNLYGPDPGRFEVLRLEGRPRTSMLSRILAACIALGDIVCVAVVLLLTLRVAVLKFQPETT